MIYHRGPAHSGRAGEQCPEAGDLGPARGGVTDMMVLWAGKRQVRPRLQDLSHDTGVGDGVCVDRSLERRLPGMAISGIARQLPPIAGCGAVWPA